MESIARSETNLTLRDEQPYCIGCGEYFGDDMESKPSHLCQFPDDEDFCGECGAELAANKACLNDHREEGR